MLGNTDKPIERQQQDTFDADFFREFEGDIFKSMNFSVWQPRKNTHTRRISDTWGTFPTEFAGIKYELDYLLKTNYAVGRNRCFSRR